MGAEYMGTQMKLAIGALLLVLGVDSVPKKPLVAYVPGLFGTRLRAKGPNMSFTEECAFKSLPGDYNEVVWIDTMNTIMRFFSSNKLACFQQTLKMKVERVGGQLKFESFMKDMEISVETTSPFNTTPVDRLLYLGILERISSGGSYFEQLTTKLTNKLGYKKNENDSDLFAFPYDWRKGPLDFDFSVVTKEIERRVALLDRKVLLVTHSMGSQFALWFLNAYVTREWKDKHIAGWMSFNGAFGGAAKALQGSVAGATIQSIFFDDKVMRGFNDAVPSISTLGQMSAYEYGFMNAIKINGGTFLKSKEKPTDEGGTFEIPDFAIPARFYNQLFPHNSNRRAVADRAVELDYSFLMKDPEVPTWCFSSSYSGGTVQSFSLGRDDYGYIKLQENAKIDTVTDGDGTVPLWSQEICRRWDSTVFSYRFDRMDHPSTEHQEIIATNSVMHLLFLSIVEKVSQHPVASDPKQAHVLKRDAKSQSRPAAYFSMLDTLRKDSILSYANSASNHYIRTYCGSTKMPSVMPDQEECPRDLNVWEPLDEEEKGFDQTYRGNVFYDRDSSGVKVTDRDDTWIRQLKEQSGDGENEEKKTFSILQAFKERMNGNGRARKFLNKETGEVRTLLHDPSGDADVIGYDEKNAPIRKKKFIIVPKKMKEEVAKETERRRLQHDYEVVYLESTDELLKSASEKYLDAVNRSMLPPRPLVAPSLQPFKLRNSGANNRSMLRGEREGSVQLLGSSEKDNDEEIERLLADLDRDMFAASKGREHISKRVTNVVSTSKPLSLYGDFGIQQLNIPLNQAISNDIITGRLLLSEYLVPPTPFKPVHSLAKYPPPLSVEEVYSDCGLRCDKSVFNWARNKNGSLKEKVEFDESKVKVVGPLNGEEMDASRHEYGFIPNDADDKWVESRKRQQRRM
eukprot:GDKK01046859.1.p1 GENE.GDKK01046859.1~~GDKK01046859.1.p1  ORF type:complete len:911 (+),score=207.90 GDKK01046859.1:1-2733(+)